MPQRIKLNPNDFYLLGCCSMFTNVSEVKLPPSSRRSPYCIALMMEAARYCLLSNYKQQASFPQLTLSVITLRTFQELYVKAFVNYKSRNKCKFVVLGNSSFLTLPCIQFYGSHLQIAALEPTMYLVQQLPTFKDAASAQDG